MFVCCECCVLPGRGLWDGLIIPVRNPTDYGASLPWSTLGQVSTRSNKGNVRTVSSESRCGFRLRCVNLVVSIEVTV
jgi:hypothetical protein